MSSTSQNQNAERGERRRRRARGACLAALGGGVLLVLGGCNGTPESFRPVTDHGRSIANLFTWVMILSGLVFLLVVGLLTVILIRFRARPDAGPASSRSGHRALEIGWTAAPALLLTVVFIFTVRTMLAVGDPPANELRVQVIGHQWWWEYRYPDLGVVTANELYLPVGRPVRLEITSDDVIHSFWVPQLGWKMDALPGRTTRMSFTADTAGTYDGTCTEFCGEEHAWMRIRVVTEAAPTFDAWARQQAQPAMAPSDDVTRTGQSVLLANTCIACHTVRGTAANGTVGPDLTHFGSRTTLGAGVATNTADNLRTWIGDASAIKPGVLMPSFNLSDDQLNALIRYLESLQ